MGEKRNFAALEWVIGEISDTLTEARQSLEAYVDDPKDSTRIRFCLTHIHQVHGTLQMVEFHGAALLAEEMEHTAQAIMDNTVASVPEAQEVLMRSLLQLPILLDHIKSSKEDNPVRVMPLLNDLRAVRKQSYLSETNLFSPDFSSLDQPSGDRHEVLKNPEKLAQVLKKLREMYQFAAASVLRGIKVEENLNYLDKVFSRLELITSGTASYPNWEVSAALVDALRRNDVDLTVAVRGLLRYIARELRLLGDNPTLACEKRPRETLLKNLLYYVARARDGSEKVAAVKKKYGLSAALLHADEKADSSQDILQAPDAGAIRSVVLALQDEIGSIKRVLDSTLTGQGGSTSEIKEVLPVVKRVSDTLAVLGIGDLRKQMLVQSELLEKVSEANSIDENVLMQAAGGIIEIEHRLEAIAKSAGKHGDLGNVNEREVEIDNAKATVIKECAGGLQKAKDAIIEYISSQWDKEHLKDIDVFLTDIRGGLNMIPLPRPAAIIDSCAAYIQENLIEGDEHPSFQALESLADAMSSVEYYLERLMEDLNQGSDTTLDIAEESVANLGYKVVKLEAPAIEEPANDNVIAAEPSHWQQSQSPEEEPHEQELDALGAAIEEQASQEAAAEQPSADVAAEDTSEAGDASAETQEAAAVSDDDLASETAVAEESPAPSPEEQGDKVAAPAAKVSTPPAPPPEPESDIDDEIIEIFIEEAGEVLETLNEFYPLWRNNESDQESLTIVRRAFHTLKGSGRMVEAFDIGELAWSVENMLNRVIDGTISIEPQLHNLIDAVIAVVPVLVDAFEKRQANPIKPLTTQYETWGHEISEGNTLEVLAQPLPPYDMDSGPQVSAAGEVAADQVVEGVEAETQEPQPILEEPQPTIEEPQPTTEEPQPDIEEPRAEAELPHIETEDPQPESEELQPETEAFQPATEPDFEISAEPESDTAVFEQDSGLVAADFDSDEDEGVDSVLQEIFSQESATHLETLDAFIRQMRDDAPIYSQPTDALQRALHTLKGSAKMAQVWPIAEIAEPLEHFTKELISFQMSVDSDILQLLEDASEYTATAIKQIDAGEAVVIPKKDQFIARARELRNLAVGHFDSIRDTDEGEHKVDPRMLSLVMAEEMGLLLQADTLLDRSREDFKTTEQDIRALVAELAVLEEGANHANLPDMSQLSAQLRSAHEMALDGRLASDDRYHDTMHKAHEALLDMVDAVAAGQNVVSPEDEILSSVQALIDSAEVVSDVAVEPSSGEASMGLEIGEPDVQYDAQSQVETEDVPAFLPQEPFEETIETSAEPEFDASASEAQSGEIVAEEGEFSFDFSASEDQEISFEALPEDGEIVFDEEALKDEPEISFAEDSDADEGSLPLIALEEDSESEISVEAFNEGEVEAVSEDISDDEASRESDTDEVEAQVVVPTLDDTFEIPVLDDTDSDLPLELTTDGALPGDEEEISFEALSEDGDDDALIVVDDESLDGEELTAFSAELGDVSFDAADSEEPSFEAADTDEGEEIADGFTLDLGSFEVEEFDASDDASEELSVGADSEEVVVPDQAAAEVEVAAAKDDRTIHIPGLIDRIDIHSPDFDADILEVFLEEAEELVEGLDEAIHAWESNWTDPESLEEIKRILHTLKGGARLSGMNNLGDLTHDYETMLIEMGSDLSGVDKPFFATIHGYQDKILGTVRGVKTFLGGDYDVAEIVSAPAAKPADETPEETEDKDRQEPTAAQPVAAVKEEREATNIFQFQPKPRGSDVEPAEFVMPSVSSGSGATAGVALKKAGPQEVVKVSSELLEELVNLAGETSINRSRLEQYVHDFGHSLDEVDVTLSRLQDQLRRLDIETEAQILFRQEQMEAHDEFDPLEMDRYSHLQQLSRSLIESASDLTDLKSDLGEKLKVTETLLIQQSRINTTLQEGLMRSRMVPFSRMVPRLRRIVRQVASELGKNVSFELDNVEGELDRSVLERMVPPFEHMLRNAVDHGIESPEDRIAAGKSEAGRVVLTLAREGGDVIIRLADDGRGINLTRVREKAIERELMSADAELTDHDIMQFILHAGFSTAETVSQISGRGVGMDVVSSEIKQLGGSVTINSAWGKGTEFIVRLPFTLSVNRALMVAIGTDHYAVPLSSIEGIVRVSPFELEHYYSNPEAQFEYANENYQVRYLGSLLYRGTQANLEGQALPMPVLLVRSAEHTMAIQVDAVMGSREIVVKSLGQQFSTVAGLSGATVMGDGSVVVIIDPHALVRQEIAQANLQLEDDSVELLVNQVEDDRIRQIMVVDDSVTVRKVTTRFLEREGFEVITAKDGVDALRLLQEGLPDLMLLDIEMPRMDGFEVAKTVRTTQRWEQLPIIMITSRTGDKHREHALSLGVNNYLGKPYQEDILLEAIGDILDVKAHRN